MAVSPLSANDRPLSVPEAANALAALAIAFGDQVASDWVARIRAEVAPDLVGAGAEAQLRLHTMLLCYAWADRTAFARCGPSRHASLMDLARQRFCELIAATGGAELANNAGFLQSIRKIVDEASVRWASYPVTPKAGVTSPKGTFFWEFAAEMSELAGYPKHLSIIYSILPSAASCVKALNPEQVINRVSWEDDT